MTETSLFYDPALFLALMVGLREGGHHNLCIVRVTTGPNNTLRIEAGIQNGWGEFEGCGYDHLQTEFQLPFAVKVQSN